MRRHRARLTRTLFDVAKPWGAADVACVAPGPVYVGAFIALPVFGTEQAAGLFRRGLSDFGAGLLFAPTATTVGVASCRSMLRGTTVGTLLAAPVTLIAAGKV